MDKLPPAFERRCIRAEPLRSASPFGPIAADEALEFSVEFASVTAFGTGGVVEDPAEAREALQMLLDKYAPALRPGRDYRAITAGELKRTSVYRIDIEEWTGKLGSAEC